MFGKSEGKTNADITPVVAELQDFERRKVVFNLDRFRSFVKKHPAMLVPVSHAWQVLQNKTLGANAWECLAEKRTKLSNGRYFPVKKFIAMQGSGKPYTSLSTPGQSRDDESHHQDLEREAAQGSFAGGIKTTVAATSFESSDLAGDSPCMTTSSKPSNGGLTDSAKVRWTASLQSLVTAVSAKHSRRSKTKVHASPKSSGASSGSGTNRNKPKSRTNSNSADGDIADSAKAGAASTPIGAFAKPTAFTATNTSTSVANLDAGNGGALETVRRKSVTFGDIAEGVPIVPTATAATAITRDAGSSSPKNADSARRNAPTNISPRPVGGAGAGVGARAGNSPTASPTNATSARSTAGVGPSTSSQRRGSKDIVIWSNDSQSTQPTNISPKSANQSPINANSNNNKNFHGHHGLYSNTSTPASTARTGMNGEGRETNPIVVFNDKMAFVPHDDAALAVRSRPAARRSVILPGAVEDAQDLNEYMDLHQKCRSLE
uniref:Uncharacterized protein n=1 Tax=Spumella elongata TaxID=89044 RepID=A0A7S3GTB2_9STRA